MVTKGYIEVYDPHIQDLRNRLDKNKYDPDLAEVREIYRLVRVYNLTFMYPQLIEAIASLSSNDIEGACKSLYLGNCYLASLRHNNTRARIAAKKPQKLNQHKRKKKA